MLIGSKLVNIYVCVCVCVCVWLKKVIIHTYREQASHMTDYHFYIRRWNSLIIWCNDMYIVPQLQQFTTPMILITFKPPPMDYAFKHDVNWTRWKYLFKKYLEHRKNLWLQNIVVSLFLSSINDTRKYTYVLINPSTWHRCDRRSIFNA